MEAIMKDIIAQIIEGSRGGVKENVVKALDSGLDAQKILNDGLVAGMAEVGRLYEAGEYFVPEMLLAARAMQDGLAILKPMLAEADVKPAGTVAAGTVKGDLHDIGKNLVCMMLEGAGFKIHDLGADVAPEKFVEAARSGGVDVIAMSALLTTTMPNMKVTIDALKAAGLRDKVKVMVGGAPITETYAQTIGADGYAEDASRAVKLAKLLVAG
jgi:5-methyltetrahydrofolate--homocysteine methyltransferase